MNTLNPSLQKPPGTTALRLLDRVREKIRLKHYSLRTEEAYTDWIRRFILHHGKRHPDGMGAVEVAAFLKREGLVLKFEGPGGTVTVRPVQVETATSLTDRPGILVGLGESDPERIPSGVRAWLEHSNCSLS